MKGELKRGQKAALVINLYYEEERRKAKERQVASGEIYGISKEKVIPNLDEPIFEGTTNEILATKSGVGKSNIAYLIAVKKKRPDLFEKVFNGNYSINKAYTEMKRDEAPVTTEEERVKLRRWSMFIRGRLGNKKELRFGWHSSFMYYQIIIIGNFYKKY